MAGLLAACGGGGGDSNAGGGGGGAPVGGGPVTISGKALYEFPPPAAGCRGLDFNAVQRRPIRQATVQVLDATTDAVLDAGVTADNGDFALTVAANTDVHLRVRAELQRTGTPSWNVEVRDNTVTESASGAELGLENRPLYVLDTAPFDSGNVDLAHDVLATTGWNNSTDSYTGTRSAAPFAVLDTAYAGMLLVLGEKPATVFEPLDIFWSVGNQPTPGATNIDTGDIGTSFYSSNNNHLFLLGAAGSDADEFDDHVVAHEWGHYFEDTFSRSDSIGGAHSITNALDMRVAFSEGFATALSGVALRDPVYCDTPLGLRIDIEDHDGGTEGWFNEISVMEIIYDLWDTMGDSANNDFGTVGFGPIYQVMTGAQASTPAFTTIFSFATALKAENPLDDAFINQLLAAQDIQGEGMTAFGSTETNDGDRSDDLLGTDEDVLPVYREVVPDGSTINVCSNSQYDQGGNAFTGNKLSEHRFLRMTIDTPARYTFDIRTTNTADLPPDDPDNDRDQSDPDILILMNGAQQNQVVNEDLQGFSGVANQEVFTTPNELPAGEYVMALVEFRYQDEQTPPDYPPRTCFDVTVGPAA